MPRTSKVTRQERNESRVHLTRVKKRVPPIKRQKIAGTNSASAKKIKKTNVSKVPEDFNKHFKMIDFLLIFKTLSTIVKCAKCGEQVAFRCCHEEGLAFDLEVKCKKCAPQYIPSSEKIGTRSEINFQFIFVMRVLGLGLSACNKFCGLLDLSRNFMSQPTYTIYIGKLSSTVKTVAGTFFSSAVKEEQKETDIQEETKNTTVLTCSGDGTWMKQGFTSLFGVSTLIGHYTGKVLDIFCSSSYCQLCKIWDKKLDTAEFAEWHESHIANGQCSANHVGPSGNMEVSAVKQMFERSMKNYGVRYGKYIGDGDSKTYSGVIQAKPYGDDLIVKKKECVGHVQKRMGKRLRDLVNNTVEEKEIKTGANAGKKRRSKILGGKGKLTAKVIDSLTKYYGLAIRNNCDSVEEMHNAIWATYYHLSSTDENPQHQLCPSGENSWCKFQKAKAKNLTFHHDYNPLPGDVLQAIHPIYEDLSKQELLERCLGGFTQNTNESLNKVIWTIAPKKSSGTLPLVEFAAHVAACTFNEGCAALLWFMHKAGISLGPSSHAYAQREDETRIVKADKKAAKETKEARIKRRQDKKQALDDQMAQEEVQYGPGIDDSHIG